MKKIERGLIGIPDPIVLTFKWDSKAEEIAVYSLHECLGTTNALRTNGIVIWKTLIKTVINGTVYLQKYI